MSVTERVVALVPVVSLAHTVERMFAARIRELGLTAYGDTEEEAVEKVKRMFATYVYAHRKQGTLENCLEHSGLQWWWEKNYPGPLPIERVSRENATGVTPMPTHRTVVRAWGPVRELVTA